MDDSIKMIREAKKSENERIKRTFVYTELLKQHIELQEQHRLLESKCTDLLNLQSTYENLLKEHRVFVERYEDLLARNEQAVKNLAKLRSKFERWLIALFNSEV
jgi:hypothetical protein